MKLNYLYVSINNNFYKICLLYDISKVTPAYKRQEHTDVINTCMI